MIIKGTDPITVEHPIFLIVGEPGVGKSTLGYSADRPLLLDFDGGAQRAKNRRDTWKITTWADVVALDEKKLAKYHTLIADTVGRCLDLLTLDIIRENPKLGMGGTMTQQGWGTLKHRFRQWMNLLRSYGKDVILLAHAKEERDGELRIVRADITGGSYSEVMKIADFVGFLYMSGNQRVLDFSPTDRWSGKNPGEWPPFKVPPVEEAAHVMRDLIVKGRAALGAISEESAVALTELEEWQIAVESCQLAADFTRLLPQLEKMSKAVAPQAKRLLWEAAKARSITFKEKAFIDPEPVEAGV